MSMFIVAPGTEVAADRDSCAVDRLRRAVALQGVNDPHIVYSVLGAHVVMSLSQPQNRNMGILYHDKRTTRLVSARPVPAPECTCLFRDQLNST